ncbi:MAG: hypothetical protein PHZ09_04280 [Eubacteriales bacterium]|jgi:predicted HicB family RNase H-like nuclease|nr:hypothetical protein [Eubacteriales bacterium]
MNKMLEYRGYVGSVHAARDGVLSGKVMGIRALITYEGTNYEELTDNFRHAVNAYLSAGDSKAHRQSAPAESMRREDFTQNPPMV